MRKARMRSGVQDDPDGGAEGAAEVFTVLLGTIVRTASTTTMAAVTPGYETSTASKILELESRGSGATLRSSHQYHGTARGLTMAPLRSCAVLAAVP
jgi:hypothetical protein